MASGLLVGVAILMKQHGAAFVLFGLGYLVLGRRVSWRPALIDGLVFALAAAAPYGLTCLAMYRAGAFAPFWFWTVTYAREYAIDVVPLAEGLRLLGGEVADIGRASIALWLLAIVRATAPWWDSAARQRRSFLALFVLFSFAAVWPGLRFTSHYFVLVLPAASVLVGVAVSAIARRGPMLGPGLLLVAAALAVADERDFLFTLPPDAVARTIYGVNPFPEAVEVARYVREHSAPDERIAVIGSEPEIYFYARRRAATTYMYTYPMMEPQPFARRMQEDMIAQVERARPRFLVLVDVDTSWSKRSDSPSLVFDWSEHLVNERYEAVGLVDILGDRPTIFRWDAAAREESVRSSARVMIFRERS